MKKSLICFSLPFLGLILTSSCKGNTSSSVSSTPNHSSTSSILGTSTPTKKTQNEERYNEFNASSATDIVYALGKVVQIEKYKYQTNVNAYVQDGDYFYQIINVPSEMVELNSYYQFQGEKKISSTYGSRISYSADSDVIKLGQEMIDLYELEAKPIPTVSDISLIPYYPYIANIELTLTDKTTLRTDDSFDKPYIEAKDSQNNTINIEVNSMLENGDKLLEKVESLPLLNKFNVDSLVFYSSTVARVFSANQVK